jgi:hypothetical protein
MPRKSKFIDDKTVRFSDEETVPEPGPRPPTTPPVTPLAPAAAAARAARSSRVAADGDTMDGLSDHPDTLTDARFEIGTTSDELVINYRDESELTIGKAEEEFDARQTGERAARRSQKARTTVVAVKKVAAAARAMRPGPDPTDDEKTKERK